MKPLVIIGSAPCAREDLDRIPWHSNYDHMAVGLSSLDVYSGTLQYIANNHPENIPKIRGIMMERHEACGGNWEYRIIGPDSGPGVDIVEPYRPPTGSSAITGALAAIRMGYRKIILAGCPLTGKARGGNPYEEFRAGWEAKKDELIGIVRSMSGWTRDFLGEPSEEWLWRKNQREGMNLAKIKINKELTSRWDFLIELAKGYAWERGAELGVWYGKTFFHLLDALPSLDLIGVDIWNDNNCDKVTHHQVQERNKEQVYLKQQNYAGRSKILEMTTTEAVGHVDDGSLDFVFIDAAHDYMSVMEDIANWMPKLKSGGFLTGHDHDWPTVEAAANDSLLGVSVHKAGSDIVWAWRKP